MSNATFEELSKVDVSKHVEKKQNLSYLSWSWAWDEFKRRCPDATYEVVRFENGLPYSYDPKTGYMVYTKVTSGGITHEMWLPVMDNNNNAMLDHPYEYETKYGKKKVAACTMFEVNKAIMRCLVKNLAMFGLGLYIYSGEDLPEETATTPSSPVKAVVTDPETKKAIETLESYIKDGKLNKDWIGKAQMYINTANLEGINKTINYIEGQMKVEAAFDNA